MTESKLVYSIYIRATPEKIWEAITNPEFTRQYWSAEHSSDWKPGSHWKLILNKNKEVKMTGDVVECAPPKRLVVTWARPEDFSHKEKHSLVEYDIEQIEDMTRLTVTHSRLEKDGEMYKGIIGGWPRVLSSLKSLLETGKALDVTAGKTCS